MFRDLLSLLQKSITIGKQLVTTAIKRTFLVILSQSGFEPLKSESSVTVNPKNLFYYMYSHFN